METKIREICERYEADRCFLVPILQDVQQVLNYLPRAALEQVGVELGIPLSRVYEVATFYRTFSLQPRGRTQMSLCTGTACHVRGAPLVREHLERRLGIRAGETTPDLAYTFETVNCLGACALGPILTVNGEYHGHITMAKADKILKKMEKGVETDEQD